MVEKAFRSLTRNIRVLQLLSLGSPALKSVLFLALQVPNTALLQHTVGIEIATSRALSHWSHGHYASNKPQVEVQVSGMV